MITMKALTRKLVKQGNGGLTVCLPKEWISSQFLKAGDEIRFYRQEQSLLILNPNNKKKRILKVSFSNIDESLIRSELTNAYRNGYDVIECTVNPVAFDTIKSICSDYLLGFEVFEKDEKTILLESMFLSEFQNFDHIISKFFITGELIFNKFLKEDITRYVKDFEKYSNYFKRMIILGSFSMEKNYFFWTFISDLSHVFRMCKYIQVENDLSKYKGNSSLEKLTSSLNNMYSILKYTYLKKNNSRLDELYTFQKNLVFTLPEQFYKDISPQLVSQLIVIGRLLYLATSPLRGVLQGN